MALEMNPEKVAFFEHWESEYTALTFDDVRMRNDRMSTVSAADVSLRSYFSRNVELKVPVVSSPMDTVTESEMAIAMAKLGGLGVIHGGLSIEDQAREVRKVKWNLNGFIRTPITIRDSDTVESVLQMCERRGFNFQSFPVVDENDRLVGMFTQSDFDYNEDKTEVIGQGMTPLEKVHTATSGTDPSEAYRIMRDNGKLNALPLIDENGKLAGLYIKSDVLRLTRGNPDNYNLDKTGRLMVGIAVPTDPEQAIMRMEACAGYADVAVIDTARGNSKHMPPTLRAMKDQIGNMKNESFAPDIVAGNISHGEPAKVLVNEGADGLRDGNGGGSICTTRENTGTGTPQLSAVYRVVKAIGDEVPVCSDGGIVYPGDIGLAIAAGAQSVMMGRGLAGTKETPGEVEFENGEFKKSYRGMGSEEAIRDSNARGYNVSSGVIAAEGVPTKLTYRGSVVDIMTRYTQYLRSTLEYVGADDIPMFRKNANFDKITDGGLRESRTHDI